MKRYYDDQSDSEKLHNSKVQKTTSINNHHDRQTCSFATQPTSIFHGPFPYFREPKEVGSFCQDARRKFKHDRSQLKHYCPPQGGVDKPIEFNLREGYDVFIKRDDSVRENLDDLLRWIRLNREKFTVADASPALSADKTCLFTDFICWRGLITKLLCTPYENRDGWKIAVTLYNNTYYLCEFDTEERARQKESETEKQKEMSYWGYKFEQFVTADKAPADGGVPNTSVPVNSNEAFCSIVRTRLHKHSLVFGGEVDCCEPKGENTQYVELKTSRQIYHPKQDRNFKKFKLIKWWAQSFLIGIPKIVCGFRDDNGVVNALHDFHTNQIPKMCKDIPNAWDAATCFNFCQRFLQFIKENVKTDNPRIAYLFTWCPGEVVTGEEQPLDSQYTFLPAWYYNLETT